MKSQSIAKIKRLFLSFSGAAALVLSTACVQLENPATETNSGGGTSLGNSSGPKSFSYSTRRDKNGRAVILVGAKSKKYDISSILKKYEGDITYEVKVGGRSVLAYKGSASASSGTLSLAAGSYTLEVSSDGTVDKYNL